MKTPEFAVAFSVCKATFRDLSGFRGYPKEGPGEDHFVKAFQAAIVSVDHGRAVVNSFTGRESPTIQEIRDSAFNLRSQFQPPEDLKAAWEAEYGKPAAVIPETEQPRREIDILWRKIMSVEKYQGRDGRQKLQRTPWPMLAKLARDFGHEEIARAWERC